jgi:hypothetical protein
MANLREKIDTEIRVREMLEDNGVPAPDEIEYGHTCIRCFWHEPKLVLVIDIDDPPPGFELIGENLDDLDEEAVAALEEAEHPDEDGFADRGGEAA